MDKLKKYQDNILKKVSNDFGIDIDELYQKCSFSDQELNKFLDSQKSKCQNKSKLTITLTYGDAGENHVGMDTIGNKLEKGNGFSKEDLIKYKETFENLGCECELVLLNNLAIETNNNEVQDAYLLIIRNLVDILLNEENGNSNLLIEELFKFEWDKKYWDRRRKKVLNKHARENVCFDNEGSEPDYENGKGKVVSFRDVNYTNFIRLKFIELLGEKCNDLICEGNKYYDLNKCGIGYHGDTERVKVIGIRLGETMPIHFNWFYKSKPIGETFKLNLNNGDGYFMSEKAVGMDWKKKNSYTLRHAAGCNKYLKLKK